MSLISIVFVILACLISAFFLMLFSTSFRRIYKKKFQKQLTSLGSRFFYESLHQIFLAKHEYYEDIFFSLLCSQNIVRFSYAAFVMILIAKLELFIFHSSSLLNSTQEPGLFLSGVGLLTCLIILFFLIGDYLPRVIAIRFPAKSLQASAFIVSILLTLAFPLTYLCLILFEKMFPSLRLDYLHESTTQAKQEIMDIVQETELEDSLDSQDKKLIASVFKFKQYSVREIMVPRVDVFGLSAEISIKEAAALLREEGYSRVPVYRGNMDNIVGILMYKDIQQKFMEYEQSGNQLKILQASIESIMKAPLYIPETKRISNLLQEFRKKQVHMAIVVDEYGGTEGIVTIEDILEQIVGEISDEYDEDEESFFTRTEGGWIVDARMNILDIEEQLGIRIPQEGDYDTIGGYIFHCAGAIPSRGFVIHHDDYELVVLRSSDRCVEKVRIKPTASNTISAKVYE